MPTDELFLPLESGPCRKHSTKITIVGIGAVGTSAAFAIINKGVASTVVLYDIDGNKCDGEVMDMQQGSQFLDSCTIMGGKDISKTANSDLIVITAGARQAVGESRLNLVHRNVEIFKGLIPSLVELSPNSILLVITNPVDIMTYVTWKLSGFPKNRVFGSGTTLDSARFRYLLGKKLNLNPTAIHGYVIGEHGDTSVPVWSKVTVGGVNINDIYPKIGQPDDPHDFASIHKTVVDSAYEIIRLKGCTSWAIGLCCAALCSAILKNSGVIFPVSVCLKGKFGIEEDVFTGMPCVIGSSGISSVVNLDLSSEEKEKLFASVRTLQHITSGIDWRVK